MELFFDIETVVHLDSNVLIYINNDVNACY